METRIHKISLDTLVYAFRESLVALIPSMEKVEISWRDVDAYDDWDNICDVLYQSIVVNSVQEELINCFPLAKYNFIIPTYSDKSFLEIFDKNEKNNFAFIGFSTLKNPFDSVDVAVLNTYLTPVELKKISLSGICFNLCINDHLKITKKNNFEFFL